MKILIIQQKMIGDVLTSSVLFEAIKNHRSDCELHYLINSHTFPVVENNPFIDKFIFFTPKIEKSKLKLLKLALKVRKEKYDVVIDVYSKTSSNIISLFSGASKKISKYKWYTSFIYSHTFKDQTQPKTNAGLAIENRMQLLQPLMKTNSTIVRPKVYLTDLEIKQAKSYLWSSGIDITKPLYMIGVLGSSEEKTYPPCYMANIIDTIVSHTKGQILFNYIPKQEEEAKHIFTLCKVETQQSVFFDVFGRSLREFLSITKHCTALIGNEGGATNMAKALNIPTFTIFSPWILKEAWNMFEDGSTHVSVHLKDVLPNIYKGKSLKEMRKNVEHNYQLFTPELITPKLLQFLENH